MLGNLVNITNLLGTKAFIIRNYFTFTTNIGAQTTEELEL